MYAEEKNEMCSSSAFNVHEKGFLVDLCHQKKHLLKKNSDLKLALNNNEDVSADLDRKNSALKKQIKRMQPSVKDLGQLRAEIVQMRAALAKNEMASLSLKARISKMLKGNEMLKEHLETITFEKSDNLLAKDMDKRQITNLSIDVQTLQNELELTRMAIEREKERISHKDFVIDQKKAAIDELICITQDLKKRAQDLKGQLGLPAHHGGLSGQGCFMTSGGQYPADARNCLSLAEEFSLLPGFQVSVDKEVKVAETTILQKETTDQSEGEETIEKMTASDLTEVPALESSTHWLSKVWTSCKRRALTGVSFGLGVMLPFCLMGAAMTPSIFMSTDAHQAILQHSACLPPF